MALARCTTTVHIPGPFTIAEGTILDAGDPLVKKYAMFFEDVGSAVSRSEAIVDATARPGEKRARK